MGSTADTLADALHQGLRDGGVTFAVYLPDSLLYGAEIALEDDPAVTTVVCAREDEGIAVALGAALAGEVAVALMEGSGVGYAGLILARAALEPLPLLIVYSHTQGIGEQFDYHSAPAFAAEGVLSGLGIPHQAPHSLADVRSLVARALQSVRGQQRMMAVGIPGWMAGP